MPSLSSEQVSVFVCVLVCPHMFVSACMCVCMYVCMHIHVHVCVCVRMSPQINVNWRHEDNGDTALMRAARSHDENVTHLPDNLVFASLYLHLYLWILHRPWPKSREFPSTVHEEEEAEEKK